MEFPRLVYRSAADYLLVLDQDEFDAAMNDGWYASVPEASARAHDAPKFAVPDWRGASPSRQELEKQATELGLKFDGRNSNGSLTRMIDDALKA